MADEHERPALRREGCFQPFDGRHVEVVGRLVEQQDVRLRRQHPGERGAARFPARQPLRIFIAREAELLQQVARLMRVVARPEARFDIRQRRRMPGEIRLLRQVAHAGPRLHEALARDPAR